MIRIFCGFATAALLTGLVLVSGCSTGTELGGARIPNARPDTELTGQPPTLLEAGFIVDFNWTGSDADGRIAGYQWKISDNGVDGISPRDTVTIDPLTGAVLHPWRFTTASDSSFYVLADQDSFPSDDGLDPRSFRTHTLFIRSVDDKGAVDPVPAQISFTSTTIVPTVRVIFPSVGNSAKQVPTTVNVGWSGTDDDFSSGTPTKVRYLWKEAVDPDGNPIIDQLSYELWADEIIDFEDPAWKPWQRYAPLEEDRKVSFPEQPDGEYFLFAVQAQDTAGAVSIGRGYQLQVLHCQVNENFYSPSLSVSEPFISLQPGCCPTAQIAGGQPLNFGWAASASHYAGNIVSYRHGWDLADITDPDDPGWAVPPGLSDQNRYATETSFDEGLHKFYVQAIDDSGISNTVTVTLDVIQYVDPGSQRPLLIMDQVIDNNVSNWEDQNGVFRNDQQFRNAYWQFLRPVPGGVFEMNWERDWKNHTVEVKYADIVHYKVALIYAKYHSSNQTTLIKMRPVNGRDQFVWLDPYQAKGGNIFFVGGASLESFLEPVGNYMVPIIFNTRETVLTYNNQTYTVGFGDRRLPDGTEVQRGPLQYQYQTVGISTLDWTSPIHNIYGRPNQGRSDRRVECVGLKSLQLVPEFKSNHLIGPGVIADNIRTDAVIDWWDEAVHPEEEGHEFEHTVFSFNDDEFVNRNLSSRGTNWNEQLCAENLATGLCIEPMFTGTARFDFLREKHRAEGQTEWPMGAYTTLELNSYCGQMALTDYEGITNGSARTTGLTYGYASYKRIADKPSQKPDIYWGFDPYRFDHTETKKAIRWVLQYFGLNIIQE